MYESLEIRQELRDRVEQIQSGDTEATIALRALYGLYFTSKSTATTDEKRFLLAVGSSFSLDKNVPVDQDKEIFAEEAEKHYSQPKGS